MQVVLEIPEELSQRLSRDGRSAARATLEALAIEGYRTGAFTPRETRDLLGFETRYELDGFLKAHGVEEGAYSLEDLQRDDQVLENLPL
jgi:hypothetical protein